MTKTTRAPGHHDYTRRGWGHDYTFESRDGGQTATALGWGHGIREGDYLVLQSAEPHGSTRYRVRSISYYLDPRDMWKAELVFAPRTEEEVREWNESRPKRLFA